jgi:hypothetical protein
LARAARGHDPPAARGGSAGDNSGASMSAADTAIVSAGDDMVAQAAPCRRERKKAQQDGYDAMMSARSCRVMKTFKVGLATRRTHPIRA